MSTLNEFYSKGNRLSLQQLLVPHQDQQHKEKVERDCFLRKGPKYIMSILHGNGNDMAWLRDDFGNAIDLRNHNVKKITTTD